MPADGRPYRRAHAIFKARCRDNQEPCWLCRGRLGPINYDSAQQEDPLAFTVDHVDPTSHGGHKTNATGFRPAHSTCNSSRGNGQTKLFPTSRRWLK